jgi:hypothetical protein
MNDNPGPWRNSANTHFDEGTTYVNPFVSRRSIKIKYVIATIFFFSGMAIMYGTFLWYAQPTNNHVIHDSMKISAGIGFIMFMYGMIRMFWLRFIDWMERGEI